ncbi:MAG TPA: hypothetical protein DDX05_04565 [Deltaproteobacteria bacterium]|nr:MAG: hypothetical protein A2X90_10600 [Deltaproteobacteria bacterium GWA2_65_63]OGP29119.1 MAG: hypothetical protein A2X91_11005 [Deltaproteobacteria bacterium GWB2_65_81]HAM33122.1 hypothetical protein [Deltaproteobacteria bacterium]HBG72885.1 hypothetical protein [Deltaproteobacteria bacterium]
MGTGRFIIAVAVAALIGTGGASRAQAAPVVKEYGKVCIVDQRGERWDVTQAQSLGFEPRGFQYGIGRNAFTPLDDSRVRKENDGIPGSTRVIGVGEGPSHRAYSVPSLGSHEVANSNLGGKPIAVGY